MIHRGIRPRRGPGGALSALALLIPALLEAQQLITIGTGTGTNDFDTYPAPYGNQANGARHQMLIRASELQSAGMGAGDISSVGFEVAEASFIEFFGFTVSLGTTNDSDLGNGWIGGLTPLWGPQDFIDQGGWNTHVLDASFYWDGSSNLVVQTCFANDVGNFNSLHALSSTTFLSTQVRATNNPNVCTFNGGTINAFDLRPNMRFEWTSNEVPPEAAFNVVSFNACTGVVQFEDQSTFNPNDWQWDFGDGGTDSVQNPTHTYTADGTYYPTLIATNAFGSDTITGAALVISTSGAQPIDACVPGSAGTVAGFGILNVSINGEANPSADALSEGFADNSCQLDTVYAGTILDLGVTTGGAFEHNVRAWIDWDNSGDFIGTELVLSADNVFNAGNSLTVPVFAVLNTPLRVRVMADFTFSPYPGPCDTLEYGQAEDYGLVVLENNFPPEAAFTAEPLVTCDGTVQFTDASLNVPTSWDWDFGDGNGSTETSPSHTYAGSGTYTVELITTNAFGADTITLVDLIVVDLSGQLAPAACTPQTQAACCGYGIVSVEFAGISSTSADGTEGYMDRSCGNVGAVDEGGTYPISIGTGGIEPHTVLVWIDLDNSGDFTANEEVWNVGSGADPSGTVIIPSATAFGVPVRVRITADVVGQVNDACDDPFYGQAEDFAVIISPNPNPPTAQFTASPTNTCTGYVQFTDASTNAPDTWDWDFGDGNTSQEASPLHLYATPGFYTVSLMVTNGNGSDTQTEVDLIHFVEPAYCDTLIVPGFQPASSEACQGVLADDGGPDQDYSPGQSGTFTIAPLNAETVTLFFSQFEWEDGTDYLRIYDGPDEFSPEIGNGFTGSGIDELPNNGVITSSGPAITILQDASPGQTTWEGFLLTWDCSYTGVEEAMRDPIVNVWPQPAGEQVTIGFGQPAGAGWTLLLRDVLGAEISSERVEQGERAHALDTGALSSGVYCLSIVTPAGRWNRNIVIR